ncbi:hypothetical protein H5410_030885 [Solanum commersonii]|uniref:Uncharacterized protein n=1 Tax=Solanum commersonii TaxID=4109 RepID=A0A9J5YFJ8_SOLCO|nr:hypothetical protein H5410_030885 [Solanum commersonii]
MGIKNLKNYKSTLERSGSEVNLWRSIRTLWNELERNTKIKVNNGGKTRYPRKPLSRLAQHSNTTTQYHSRNLDTGWDITFRRQSNDWEIVRVAEFLNIIGQFSGTQEGEDELWWQGCGKGTFKVSKAYKKFPQPTAYQLAMEVYLEGQIPYKKAETVNQLFLHCKFTEQLWTLFLNLRGISWSMPGKIKQTLQSWEEIGVLAKSRSRWRIILANRW